MTRVFDIADEYVDHVARLNPITATSLGVAGVEHLLPDFSPEGSQAQADLARGVIAELATAEAMGPFTDDDRLAALSLRERLGSLMAMHEAGDELRNINVLGSPAQEIRAVFDLMPRDTREHREHLIARMLAVPSSLASWRESLRAGADAGQPAARRQAVVVADQCDTFGAIDGGWFTTMVASLDSITEAERSALGAAAEIAEQAYRESGAWLRTEYAPLCSEHDGVGVERYARMARAWNGAELDLAETFAWGWNELERITERMHGVAAQLGVPLSEVKDFLDSSPQHTITGSDELLAFLRDLTDRTTSAMDGVHFDIDPRVRECDVRLAAEGSAAAPYYVPPSEDLSRPGSTWYPTMGRQVFPRWWLVSVWYHESVPGHHLQCSTVVLERERLSRFQRTLGWTSGYGEGWALYAERLMDELGFFDDPGVEMGFLSAQAMRAVRVVVDIGLHCGLALPSGDFAGVPIDAAIAQELLESRALLDSAFAASEVNRYLGLPGQAISYKVGERVWLEVREDARRRLHDHGQTFDLKAWHSQALKLGPLGLDPFREEMRHRNG